MEFVPVCSTKCPIPFEYAADYMNLFLAISLLFFATMNNNVKRGNLSIALSFRNSKLRQGGPCLPRFLRLGALQCKRNKILSIMKEK